MPDGRAFVMIEGRSSRSNWRKLAEYVAGQYGMPVKDFIALWNDQHPDDIVTEDAEFEVLPDDIKQLPNSNHKPSGDQ